MIQGRSRGGIRTRRLTVTSSFWRVLLHANSLHATRSGMCSLGEVRRRCLSNGGTIRLARVISRRSRALSARARWRPCARAPSAGGRESVSHLFVSCCSSLQRLHAWHLPHPRAHSSAHTHVASCSELSRRPGTRRAPSRTRSRLPGIEGSTQPPARRRSRLAVTLPRGPGQLPLPRRPERPRAVAYLPTTRSRLLLLLETPMRQDSGLRPTTTSAQTNRLRAR